MHTQSQFFHIIIRLLLSITLAASLSSLASPAYAATLTVTNTNDSGPGSLRQAIADASPGGMIVFKSDLSGGTITLSSTLILARDLTIYGTSLASHVKISGGGNIRVFSVEEDSSVTLQGLDIVHGREDNGNGGGIFNSGRLMIIGSTLSDNITPGYGGGIMNTGTLTVLSSTFYGNSANFGGGISNSDGTLIVSNSTFFGNSAAYHGGGIHNYSGTLTVTNSTFSGNSANISGGGLYNFSGLTLHLTNTILADSTAGGDCVNLGIMGTDVHNLIEANSGCGTPVSTAHPGLGSLQDNLGPTYTMAIGPASPAYNAGDNSACPLSDQRGVARPQGEICDIGAYEHSGDADHDGILDSYENELIQKYAPLLMFHAEDCTRPTSVDWYLKGPTTRLAHAQEASIFGSWLYSEEVIPAGKISSGSDLLGHTSTTMVDFGSYENSDYRPVVENSGSKYISSHFYLSYDDDFVYSNGLYAFCGDFSTSTIYAHVTRASPIGAYDVTYHIFYPWNGPLCYSSGSCYGSHQGDWEMIRVRAYPGHNSDNWVYLSSHDGGGVFFPGVSIMMADNDGVDLTDLTTGSHPIVFVARDSHANYAQWGTVDRGGLPDDHSCYDISSCITYKSWSGDYYGFANGNGYHGYTAVENGSDIVNVGEYAYPEAGMEWINFSGRWGEAVNASENAECRFCYGPYGPKFQPYQPPTIITAKPPDQSAVAGEPKKFEFGTFNLLWYDVVDMQVDWGDGTTDSINYWAGGLPDKIPSHTYNQPGIYYVSYNLSHRQGIDWDGWVFVVIAIGDADNIPDQVEDGAPNNGDGNGDGIPDGQQANVTSLPTAVEGEPYATLESPGDTSLIAVTASPAPGEPPSGIEFPLGVLSFGVDDVPESEPFTVTLYVQPGVEINSYYKYGPTVEDETDHWYEFLYDGTTGAEIEGDPTSGYTITLHFVDNSRGDSNSNVGEFSDPGAPVFIPDTTPPVISPSVDGTLGTNGWYISEVSVSWSVSDEESVIKSSEGCDPTLVSSDTSEITFTCIAASLGGTSSESITIKRDTVAPTIAYLSRTEPNAEGWNNTAVTIEWACADNLSGPVAEKVSQTLSGEGADQSATGTCSDKAGNSAQDNQSGIDIDLTAPILNPTVSPDPVLLYGNATADTGASDELSGIAEQSCEPPDTGTVGEKTLTCTASDVAGNSASADVSYNVIYDFSGFFPPLGDPLSTHEAKAGSTVPVKFSLAGDQGLEVFASGYPASQEVACETLNASGDLVEVGTPGNSGLTFSNEQDQYQFNWKTEGAWKGTCRQLIVRFIDGEEYVVYFDFK